MDEDVIHITLVIDNPELITSGSVALDLEDFSSNYTLTTKETP